MPFSLALLLLLQLLLLELLGLFGSARVCDEVEVSIDSILDVPLARSSLQAPGDIDILSWLSLPIARGTLAQKVLDAPMERDTGARRAEGLRRIAGIVCNMMVICDIERVESFQGCQVESSRKSRGSGTGRIVLWKGAFNKDGKQGR